MTATERGTSLATLRSTGRIDREVTACPRTCPRPPTAPRAPRSARVPLRTDVEAARLRGGGGRARGDLPRVRDAREPAAAYSSHRLRAHEDHLEHGEACSDVSRRRE